jgi:hypothetical protein
MLTGVVVSRVALTVLLDHPSVLIVRSSTTSTGEAVVLTGVVVAQVALTVPLIPSY